MSLPPARTQRCAWCGGPATNWHEKLPRGRGGPRDPFNAVPLCGSGTTGCHGHVTEHPAWARDVGLTVEGRLTSKHGAWVYDGPDELYRRHYEGPWEPTDLCVCGHSRLLHDGTFGRCTCAAARGDCLGFALAGAP